MYENGNAYIVNKNNKIMYHETISYMSNKPSLPEDYLEVKRELNNEMTLVLSAPKDSISKKGQTSRIKVIIYSLIILSAELVLAFLALSKMTSPITELTKASKKFKEGKFDVKLNVDAMGDFKDLADGVQTLIDELNERIENVNKLAFTDSLTGVFNKTAYIDHALRLNKNVEKRRFAVVVLHLFNLIPMNDRFGREMGNEFLLTATEFISSIFNKSNVYRITGGLYTIILEDSEYERKEFLFKTFVEELKEQSIMIEQEEVQLPIAIGMAEFNKRKDKTVEDVYARADKFMQANREYIKQNLNN
jgi:diguanylate cyclase (GGDEF)-like protein